MYLKSGAGTVIVVICFLASGSAIPLVFLLYGIESFSSIFEVSSGISPDIKSDTLK